MTLTPKQAAALRDARDGKRLMRVIDGTAYVREFGQKDERHSTRMVKTMQESGLLEAAGSGCVAARITDLGRAALAEHERGRGDGR